MVLPQRPQIRMSTPGWPSKQIESDEAHVFYERRAVEELLIAIAHG